VRPGAPRHRPRKRFGQHFLAAPWARKIIAAIDPRPGDVFLEIGPGTGALTLPLAQSGAPILAVEIDRDLVTALAPRVPPNVTIVTGDVMDTDVVPFLSGLQLQRPPDSVAAPVPSRRVRIVGNLPYNLTSPILFRLAALQAQHGVFFDATLMVQREVADRLAARAGTRDYGVLTVMMRTHGAIDRLLILPPGAFSPRPKVHSAVIRLVFGPPPVRIGDPRQFERVVRGVFQQRRKTLGNALKGLSTAPLDVLAAAGLDPRRRPETLSLEELAELARQTAGAAGTRQTPVL
jgi:16S rRNA (adenine1518-N6/adenine1519-N6)-dimethyltransferase